MKTQQLPWWASVNVLGAVAVLLVSSPALGTTVIKMADEDLVRHSGIILEGQIASVQSEWNVDNTQIHTIIEIRVENLVKGSLPARQNTITLRVLGGTVEDITMWVVDSPVYTLGEEVILMLRADYKYTLFPVVGFNQGKFSIEPDPVSGVKMIEQREVSRDDFAAKLRDIVAVQSPQALGQQSDQAQEAGNEDE